MATERCPACVLLIEDDKRIRETLAGVLESRGYPTVPAEDAEEAFQQLVTIERPCLVLVDMLTLRIDGQSLLSALGPNDRIATLPMVLVSIPAPEILSRPAVVKRIVDLQIVMRIVREHCCGEDRGGPVAGRGESASHRS
jgi:CheY-like chemotaxis protein